MQAATKITTLFWPMVVIRLPTTGIDQCMHTGKDCVLMCFALSATRAKSENVCRAKTFVFQEINVSQVMQKKVL